MDDLRQNQFGLTWGIVDKLRGAMNVDEFRDYILSFLFLRYLSNNYETVVKKELGSDYIKCEKEIEEEVAMETQENFINKLKILMTNYFEELPLSKLPVKEDKVDKEVIQKTRNTLIDEYGSLLEIYKLSPLIVWYIKNLEHVTTFEKQMRKKVHFVIKPHYLWSNICELARTQNNQLLKTLQKEFKCIENEAFNDIFRGLFSGVNLDSHNLGKTYELRNNKLCLIINAIAEVLAEFPNDSNILGDAYEYLICQFSADYSKKDKEFYTQQQISTILFRIVTLDSQDSNTGKKKHLKKVLDFACGSGSLLISVRKHLGENNIGQIYGQEKNIIAYKIARMNMLLHGLKDLEFQIFHGDSLKNDWYIFREMNPAKKKIECDIVVASPPFNCTWESTNTLAQDFRFESYGLAPKSSADFAFLLHGFHFLSDTGIMAVILTQYALSRGCSEEKIRKNFLEMVILML